MVWNLSPSDTNILIAGFHHVTGFPDGTIVNIKKDTSPFTTTRTLDGEVARAYRNDQSFTLSLSIVQSSPSNDILMKLYELDTFTQNAPFPVFVKDNRGSTLFLSVDSWIKDLPAVTIGNGVEIRTWEIQCLNSIINIGGNKDGSSILDDITNIVTGALPGVSGLL